MDWEIDDLFTFTCNTHSTAGAATDADSVPTYRVYEDETGTAILTGSMAKLDDANTTGFYSEQITLSAANGFEVGKCYNIYISVVVGGVTATTHRFLKMAKAIAELSSGAPTATPTIFQAVMLLYMALRNKGTQTSTEFKVHNDAGSAICKAAVSDDGSTFTREELGAP